MPDPTPKFCDQCGAALLEQGTGRRLDNMAVDHAIQCPNRKPPAPTPLTPTYSEAAGRLALAACALLAQGMGGGLKGAKAVGDFTYSVREREGEGWEGPRVKAWSDGSMKLVDALRQSGAIP